MIFKIVFSVLIITILVLINRKLQNRKRYQEPFPHIHSEDPLTVQCQFLIDSINDADTYHKLFIVEEDIKEFGRRNKRIPGIQEDVDLFLKDVTIKRNRLIKEQIDKRK